MSEPRISIDITMLFNGDPIDLAKQFENLAEPGSDRGLATDQLVMWLRDRVLPAQASLP